MEDEKATKSAPVHSKKFTSQVAPLHQKLARVMETQKEEICSESEIRHQGKHLMEATEKEVKFKVHS